MYNITIDCIIKEVIILEKVIRVDYLDMPVGEATKEAAHKEGLLHRAFSIFIRNGNKMLIQKRADGKYHSGGLWTNACCSHPRPDEDINEAIHRRLVEELGFDCSLSEVGSFVYFREFSRDLYEYEYDHVFLGEYGGEVELNPEEASEYQWILISDLIKWVEKKPQDFTAWFITALSYALR